MYIKVSKVMADFITRTATENGEQFEAVVERMTDSAYSMFVYSGYDSRYYDNNKVIFITYPANYYASPRAVSTQELHHIYKRYHVKTEEDLKNAIIEEFAI